MSQARKSKTSGETRSSKLSKDRQKKKMKVAELIEEPEGLQ